MKKILIICVLLVTTLNARSQAQEDAWVFFTDKEDVEVRLANPISILTQEAIDRKNMHLSLIHISEPTRQAESRMPSSA